MEKKRRRRPGPQEFKRLRATKMLEKKETVDDVFGVIAYGSGLTGRVIRGIMKHQGVPTAKAPGHEAAVMKFFDRNRIHVPSKSLPDIDVAWSRPAGVLQFLYGDLAGCAAVEYRGKDRIAHWLVVTGRTCQAARDVLEKASAKKEVVSTTDDSLGLNTNTLGDYFAEWEKTLGRKVPSREVQADLFPDGRAAAPEKRAAKRRPLTGRPIPAKPADPAASAAALLSSNPRSLADAFVRVLRDGCKPIEQMGEDDFRKIGLERMSWRKVFVCPGREDRRRACERARTNGYRFALYGREVLSSSSRALVCSEEAVEAGRFVAVPPSE